jgi:hypothetical protein
MSDPVPVGVRWVVPVLAVIGVLIVALWPRHTGNDPSIYDPPMRTLLALGGGHPTSVIPSTLILDRDFKVAAAYLRALLTEDLPVIERVAAES